MKEKIELVKLWIKKAGNDLITAVSSLNFTFCSVIAKRSDEAISKKLNFTKFDIG